MSQFFPSGGQRIGVSASSEYSGLISFRIDWLDLLAVQGTLKTIEHGNKKKLAPWKKIYDQSRQHIKNQRHYFANRVPSSQSNFFSSSHVWIWELDYKESWALKNWCIWTVVLDKTLESPLDWRRFTQSILGEIRSEYSLEGLMLKLKLQYFGYLVPRTD